MNCAIAVLKRLQEKYGWPMEEAIEIGSGKLTAKGLSFYDLLCECRKVKKCQGVMSLRLITSTPYIAYISFFRQGHYVLVEEVAKKVVLYDNLHHQRTINRFLFWLVWSKKAIIFENIS